MRLLVTAACAATNLLGFAREAAAQTLKAIGKTSAGTPVYVDQGSMSRKAGILTATFRVALEPPIKAPGGDYMSLRSVMMLDCAKQLAATKERWFYTDLKQTKVARHDVPGEPGFGPAIKGSLPDIALTSLCSAKK